ncbi:unnamed protein product [Closterium sp. NIES-64]|nr:unnamed protein product [Closterium sp. NIES-64]
MTAGGPASLQRMLARLAAAKPLLPSLRGAKDVAAVPVGQRQGQGQGVGKDMAPFESTQKSQGVGKDMAPFESTQKSQGVGKDMAPLLPSLRGFKDVPPPSLPSARAARDLSHARALPSEGGALSCAAGGAVTGVAGVAGEVDGVRGGSGDGAPTACEVDTPLVSAHEVARSERAGPETAGRLEGLGRANDSAAREQSDERVLWSGGGEGSKEEVVDGGEGSGLRKGEGGGGVAGEGGTTAEGEGMARREGVDVVERGGVGGGAVEVVVSAAASLADDVAAVASSSDVASMGSGADVAGARVAVADRAGVRRALTGPAALLAFINDGAEDTAEDASIGAATTGDAQASYHPPHHSHLSCLALPPYIPLPSSLLSSLACSASPSISSRLLRLISPPSLLWQSQQPLRKKEGGSSELPNGNRIGEEQRLRLEAWLDDK